ncbi:peptide chain release factor 2 [Candidatus Dependentiae bacterium]|nr:peptide chain release factor 2 [Candidatus Dependentiae bacterium]MBU4387649.1 peptide chain release factor 2 [Candidatus Dependentiae bacterium]MCG2756348.1 peptide chain release factor 2 [Candidatus Dependentiae bacterium]
MLIDELKETLKNLEPDINAIKLFWQNSKNNEKFESLEKEINQENFWQNTKRIEISKEHQNLKTLKDNFNEIINLYTETIELLDLFAQNEEELLKLKPEINSFVKKVTKFKLELLLNKPDDSSNCFLNINSGAGGTESQDWANMLLRMYVRFCERENFKIDVLDYQSGEEAGIKSASLYIKGKNAYGFLKCENGIHRLVRISPFDANKRRHTSFAAITVTPEVEEEAIKIDEEDLRIDTYKSGGAGGQHVNKTESAIRITHIPSGIVVQCQSERSQAQNKQTAMKMLMAKLVEKQKEEQEAKEKSVEKKKIEWGSQIRSYVLHPYKMVKDLRTDCESPQPDLILDGDLMPMIEKYLVKFN